MDRWTIEYMDEWIDVQCMNGWMTRITGWMNERTDGWADRRMDWWMDGKVDTWMENGWKECRQGVNYNAMWYINIAITL